jgi:4-amino-4-deoxy-L-arabinose transferase-like glycosyltransferase
VAEISSPKRARLFNVAVLLLLCFVLLFWRLGDLPFSDRGEPREGLVVWEMHHSRNWILPAVNGEYIPFKPPLFHWLALIAAHLFGRVDELTLRLPSALLATLGVLMTYMAGARLWGERAGVIAGVVLATCVEWWQAGAATQVDMTLAFFISAACLYFYYLYTRQDFGLLTCLVLPLLLALATLTKGPVGLAVPSLVILLFLCARRDFAFVKKLHLLASTAVFLAVAGSWYALALWQGGWPFFFRQIVGETLLTAVGNYGHHQPINYYIPIFFQNTAPWSFFFPALALDLYRQRRQISREHLLFPSIWLMTVLVFFSLSLGKRGVYILPLYPAFALLFGVWWRQLEERLPANDSLTGWIGWFVAGSYALGLTALCLYSAGRNGLANSRFMDWAGRFNNVSQILDSLTAPSHMVAAALIVFAAALFCLIWALLKTNRRVIFASLTVIAVSISMIMKSAIFPPIVLARTMKPFIERVNEKIDPKLPLLFYCGFDFGAIFYSRRHIPAYARKIAELKPPFFLLMWEEDWQVLRGLDELKMVDISEGRGPAGRHRLVLVEYQSRELSVPQPLPVHCRKQNLETDAARGD